MNTGNWITGRRDRTLRQKLAGAVGVSVAIAAGFGGSYVVAQSQMSVEPPPPAESSSWTPDAGRVAQLVKRHGCWRGEAPPEMAGQIPGHVIVTTPNSRTIYSERFTGPALEQVFGEADHGLVVHAFCK